VGDEGPRFHWDAANHRHIARHNILPEEVEQVVLDPHAIFLEIEMSSGEERTKVLGSSKSGRILVTIFALRGGAIRPITSYPAPARLEVLYFQQRGL